MSNNFWEQPGQEESFRDGMEETTEGYDAPPANVKSVKRAQAKAQAPAPQQQYEEVQEEETEEYDMSGVLDEEDDYTAVLSDARLRLEQGRLYEMLMNHDIFDGLAADVGAVKSVQRQIRKWAKEQMEIMLGMRRETAKIERLEIDFPFNQVEVDVLKMVAKTASKGRSENSDRFVPDVKRTTEEVEVVPQRTEGLNRIGNRAPQPVAPKPIQQSAPDRKAAPQPAPAPKKALPQQPAKPVARKPLNKTQQQIMAEEGITQEELDAVADGGLTKPVNQMNEAELIAHNKRASGRQRKATNPQSVPHPTFDQEQMIVQTRMMDLTSQPPPGLAQVLQVMSGKQ